MFRRPRHLVHGSNSSLAAVHPTEHRSQDCLADEAADHVDDGSEDDGAEHERQQCMTDHRSTERSLTDSGVGHLKGHSYRERYVHEVQVVGRFLVAGELDAADRNCCSRGPRSGARTRCER